MITHLISMEYLWYLNMAMEHPLYMEVFLGQLFLHYILGKL